MYDVGCDGVTKGLGPRDWTPPSNPGAPGRWSEMHEVSLCQGILDIVRDQAAANGFARVRCIRLAIGTLSHVEPDAIEFCFDAVARGTVAEGARLEIERPPGQAWCAPCGRTVSIATRFDPCPDCGSHQVLVVGGEELAVRELEVE